MRKLKISNSQLKSSEFPTKKCLARSLADAKRATDAVDAELLEALRALSVQGLNECQGCWKYSRYWVC